MKLIAHRGASLERQENTLDSLLLGAELGADAVECDPRVTGDGTVVLFHDDDLRRMAGDRKRVNTITYPEMKAVMENRGLKVTTLDDVFEKYDKDTPILLDLTTGDDGTGVPHLVCDDRFFERLSRVPLNVICGIHFTEEAESASKFFPSDRILAFMPDKGMYEDFFKAGSGIIRLWEQWLDEVKPADVKEKCPGAQVYIMSNRPETGADGTPESVRYAEEIGADGVLLNDIRMAVSVIKEKRRDSSPIHA